MAEPIGVGMLGAGFIGMIHSYALRSVTLAKTRPPLLPELVALADLNAGARERCAERFGWSETGDDWHAAVQNPRVGLFVNSAPNHLHLEPSLAAARPKRWPCGASRASRATSADLVKPCRSITAS